MNELKKKKVEEEKEKLDKEIGDKLEGKDERKEIEVIERIKVENMRGEENEEWIIEDKGLEWLNIDGEDCVGGV